MISKKSRVNKKDFEEIFKTGKFLNSINFTFRFLISHHKLPTPARVSFVVPKNIVKTAVKRNFLRRRGYSVLSKKLGSFPSGFSGVFLFTKKGVEIFSKKPSKDFNPLSAMEDEIGFFLKKIKI